MQRKLYKPNKHHSDYLVECYIVEAPSPVSSTNNSPQQKKQTTSNKNKKDSGNQGKFTEIFNALKNKP